MYVLFIGGLSFLKKCERCGYTGTERVIKKCPSNIPIWNKTDICSKCYKDIKEEIKNKKTVSEKPLQKNVFRPDINPNLADKTQCPYCGSWVEQDAKMCEHCRFDFKTKKVSLKPRNYESSFEVGKDFSKIGIEKFDKKDLQYLEETDQNIPKEKFDVKPVFFIIGIFILTVFLISQFGIFSALTSTGASYNTGFIGDWQLGDMSGAADDYIDQYWSFHDNNSVKIETKPKSGEGSNSVQWLNWDTVDDKLQIYHDYSNTDTNLYFNIASSYTYIFSKTGDKVTLTFLYQNMKIDMPLNKI